MFASMPAEAAPSSVPWLRTVSPGFTSSPASRTASPSAHGEEYLYLILRDSLGFLHQHDGICAVRVWARPS